ncbi:hypothetical protein [Undibacterium sp.]|uniref:hypothetical protein n=1 Tax=Undibacterium sp. TaxID=1914977 RepID=UPI003753D90F
MNQIVVKNPWHKPGQNKEYFDYSDRPRQEYRGYDLYTVIEGKPGACQIDIVFDGECISQMAGMIATALLRSNSQSELCLSVR